MIKKIFPLFFFIITSFFSGHAQYVEWVSLAAADSSPSNFAALNVEGMYFDKKANSYYAGSRIRCMGCNTEAFIARVKDNGVQAFELNLFFDFSTATSCRSITADDSGFVYVSGFCSSNVTFYSEPITGNNTGYFLAKLDSSGNLIWCHAVDNMGQLSLSAGGNIYLSQHTASSSFIEKFDAAGDSLWAIPVGADKIVCSFPGSFYALTENDIKKFDASGGVIWAKDTVGGGSDFAIGCNDDIFVVNDSSVFKLDKNGVFGWRNSSYDGSSIAVDTTNTIFISRHDEVYSLTSDGQMENWSRTISGGLFRGISFQSPDKIYLPVYWHSYNNPLIIFPFQYLQSPFSNFDDDYIMLACLSLDTVNIPQQVLITTGDCDPQGNGFCRGTQFSIPFNTYTSVFDSANFFTAELVDEFGNALVIGTPDSAVIPYTSLPGTNYHLRILSSSPAFVSAYNSDGNVWVHDNEEALLTVNGNTAICAGDSVELQASPTGIGTVFVWKLDGNWFANTGSTFYADSAGTYSITIIQSNGFCFSNTNEQIITVNPLPANVAFTGLPDTMCVYNPPVQLSGNPAGGVFSGNGIHNGQFDPSLTGAGLNTIVYIYTDSLGCSASGQQDVFVDVCTGINDVKDQLALKTFPNPFADFLVIHTVQSSIATGKSFMQLIDPSGKVVLSATMTTPVIQIDTRKLAAGLYTCELIMGNRILRNKVSLVR